MKVKIIKCSNDNWYEDKTGEVFEVKEVHTLSTLWFITAGIYYGRTILKSDCEILPTKHTFHIGHVGRVDHNEDKLYKVNICKTCSICDCMLQTSSVTKCEMYTPKEAHVQKSDDEKSCSNCAYEELSRYSESCKNCSLGISLNKVTFNWKPKEAKDKHEQTYEKAFKDVIESTVIAQYVKSKKETKENTKKLKLRMSEKKFKKIQELICDKCALWEKDCNNVWCNLDRYLVKVVK